MTAEIVAMGAVLAVVLAAMLGIEVLGARLSLPAEVKRKAIHFVSGSVALPFPWLFSGRGPVFVLCALSVALLLGLRYLPALRRIAGGGLHGVGRASLGDLLFPLSIALLFVLADGNRLLFVAPVAVLTMADGAAALAGLRYGLSPYATAEGRKSWEGTIVFFVIAAAATLVPLLLLSDVGRTEVLLVALLVGLIGCAIEAASWYGLDNLFVPLGAYFLLRRLVGMEAAALLAELALLAFLIAVILLWSRRTMLDTQARFAALLAAYLFWIAGGAAWLAPSFAVFVLHTLLVHVPPAQRRPVHLWAPLAVALSGAPWLAAWLAGGLSFPWAYQGFCMAFAVQLCLSAVARRRHLAGERAGAADLLEWAFVSAGALGIAFHLHVGAQQAALAFVGSGVVLVAASAWLFDRVLLGDPERRRWSAEVALALAASALSLLVPALAGTLP